MPSLGALALTAAYLERAADVVTAQAWATSRPSTPLLPGDGGDIELFAGPHAWPTRRWAQQARLRFLPGRVEATTSEGRHSIGHEHAIGALLWVVPPVHTSIDEAHDPREQWADVPELDSLGTIHVLDLAGRSMGSVAVADWATQPQTAVDQALVDPTAGRIPLGAARGVWTLESLGFAGGASTIGVPLLRGIVHPPDSETSLGLLRPGPHKQAYQGRSLLPQAVTTRRRRRSSRWNTDPGPGTRLGWLLRPMAPYLVAISPLAVWIAGSRGPVTIALLLLTAAAVLDPWLAWGWALARDLRPLPRTVAAYRPAAGPSMGHRRRAHLALIGRTLRLRTGSGHEAWLPGPSDQDLGVVRLVRLLHDRAAWGVALADARGRWRAVLPAESWTPDARFEDLERFARDAGLELADQEVEPLPRLTEDVATPGSAAQADRTFGPRRRGMWTLGFWALWPTLVFVWSWGLPWRMTAVVLLVTFGAGTALHVAVVWFDAVTPRRR